jgi:hypothetical protein
MSCYFAYAEKQASLALRGLVSSSSARPTYPSRLAQNQEGNMLTDDYVMSRVADPTETVLASGDFALSDDMTLEAAVLEEVSVFSEPVLDRIRTSD